MYLAKIRAIIESDPDLAESQHEDNTNIQKIVLISYLLKTI